MVAAVVGMVGKAGKDMAVVAVVGSAAAAEAEAVFCFCPEFLSVVSLVDRPGSSGAFRPFKIAQMQHSTAE